MTVYRFVLYGIKLFDESAMVFQMIFFQVQVARKALTTLESIRSEIGLDGWQSTPVFGVSGASPPVLENLGEVAPINWESSHPSVLITASGPQGEKPLAGRIT